MGLVIVHVGTNDASTERDDRNVAEVAQSIMQGTLKDIKIILRVLPTLKFWLRFFILSAFIGFRAH